jgi:hypothetical protein
MTIWRMSMAPTSPSAARQGFRICPSRFRGLALYAGGPDAEPSQIIVDYCSDPNHGVKFPYLSNLTGTNSYQAYCIAMDFLISPQETTQRQAQDFLRETLQLTNSNAVFTAGVGLRIVPYADQPVTGNGVTYTPNLTPNIDSVTSTTSMRKASSRSSRPHSVQSDLQRLDCRVPEPGEPVQH